MTTRLICDPDLYRRHLEQDEGKALRDWIAAHGLDPATVSASDPTTIEDTRDGQVIRCYVYPLSSTGAVQVDPARPGEPLKEERVVPLTVDPPEGWPVPPAT